MSWRDVPFPISHLTPVAGKLPLNKGNLDPLAGRLFFSNVWLYYIYVWQALTSPSCLIGWHSQLLGGVLRGINTNLAHVLNVLSDMV